MKKLSLFLSALLLISLVGCTQPSKDSAQKTDLANPTQTVISTTQVKDANTEKTPLKEASIELLRANNLSYHMESDSSLLIQKEEPWSSGLKFKSAFFKDYDEQQSKRLDEFVQTFSLAGEEQIIELLKQANYADDQLQQVKANLEGQIYEISGLSNSQGSSSVAGEISDPIELRYALVKKAIENKTLSPRDKWFEVGLALYLDTQLSDKTKDIDSPRKQEFLKNLKDETKASSAVTSKVQQQYVASAKGQETLDEKLFMDTLADVSAHDNTPITDENTFLLSAKSIDGKKATSELTDLNQLSPISSYWFVKQLVDEYGADKVLALRNSSELELAITELTGQNALETFKALQSQK